MTPRERCAKLYRAGVTDTAVLAERFQRSERQINRWLIAEGAREKMRHPDIPARVEILLREGMPAAYVAAEYPGIPYAALMRVALQIPGHTAAVREWRAAWARIAARPELLALHWEIAPATLRSRKADSELAA